MNIHIIMTIIKLKIIQVTKIKITKDKNSIFKKIMKLTKIKKNQNIINADNMISQVIKIKKNQKKKITQKIKSINDMIFQVMNYPVKDN